jgi:hypothetical protein
MIHTHGFVEGPDPETCGFILWGETSCGLDPRNEIHGYKPGAAGDPPPGMTVYTITQLSTSYHPAKLELGATLMHAGGYLIVVFETKVMMQLLSSIRDCVLRHLPWINENFALVEGDATWQCSHCQQKVTGTSDNGGAVAVMRSHLLGCQDVSV